MKSTLTLIFTIIEQNLIWNIFSWHSSLLRGWGCMNQSQTVVFLTLQKKPFSELSYSCLLFLLPSLDAELWQWDPTSLSLNSSNLRSKIHVLLNFDGLVPITVLGLTAHPRIKPSLFHGLKGCDQWPNPTLKLPPKLTSLDLPSKPFSLCTQSQPTVVSFLIVVHTKCLCSSLCL